MKTGVIVQTRMTSSRLPGKVLLDLPFSSGITVLEQVIRRLKKSERLDSIIIATTTNNNDDRIVAVSKKEGASYFRGSEYDVLSRYYHAAAQNGLDVVVRVTSDCPCIDPVVLDSALDFYFHEKPDYISIKGYPLGLSVEVFSFDVLEKTFETADKDFEREHVTPYIYRSGKFILMTLNASVSLQRPDIRLCLDTKEDYALLCAVYDNLYERDNFFGAPEIVELFENKPWLRYINEKIVQKKVLDGLDEELEEAVRVLDVQDLKKAGEYIRNILKQKRWRKSGRI